MKKNVPESGTSRFTFSLINHSQLSWLDNNIDNRNKDVYIYPLLESMKNEF